MKCLLNTILQGRKWDHSDFKISVCTLAAQRKTAQQLWWTWKNKCHSLNFNQYSDNFENPLTTSKPVIMHFQIFQSDQLKKSKNSVWHYIVLSYRFKQEWSKPAGTMWLRTSETAAGPFFQYMYSSTMSHPQMVSSLFSHSAGKCRCPLFNLVLQQACNYRRVCREPQWIWQHAD